MYNPLDDTAYPNFSTATNPRLLGGSDPFMMFTPTQVTNIFRNFVTSPLALPFETVQARTGIFPNVTYPNSMCFYPIFVVSYFVWEYFHHLAIPSYLKYLSYCYH